MANGSDFIGIGMMASGAAVGFMGFVGKAAPIVPSTGLSDTGLMMIGGTMAATGFAITALSGSKNLF